jgi:hypothetical protein
MQGIRLSCKSAEQRTAVSLSVAPSLLLPFLGLSP